MAASSGSNISGYGASSYRNELKLLAGELDLSVDEVKIEKKINDLATKMFTRLIPTEDSSLVQGALKDKCSKKIIRDYSKQIRSHMKNYKSDSFQAKLELSQSSKKVHEKLLKNELKNRAIAINAANPQNRVKKLQLILEIEAYLTLKDKFIQHGYQLENKQNQRECEMLSKSKQWKEDINYELLNDMYGDDFDALKLELSHQDIRDMRE